MNAATPHPMPPATALPLDLRGRPLRDLRLSVIEACNLRCPYCMPADRVPDDYGFDSATRWWSSGTTGAGTYSFTRPRRASSK